MLDVFSSSHFKISKCIIFDIPAIQRLQSYSGFSGKFTLNHIVQILRGGKEKKILQCNWDKDPIYGKSV